MGSTQSSNGGRANNYKTPDDKTPSKSKVQNGTKQKVSDNKVDSSVRSKASVAETTESLPPPKPTRRTKRQILKQLDLKTCDDHASRVLYLTLISIKDLTIVLILQRENNSIFLNFNLNYIPISCRCSHRQ